MAKVGLQLNNEIALRFAVIINRAFVFVRNRRDGRWRHDRNVAVALELSQNWVVEEKLVDLTTEVERQHTVCAVVFDVDPVVRLAEVPGHLAKARITSEPFLKSKTQIVDLEVVLDEFSMKLSEIFSLEVGSQLMLSASPTSKVKCRIGDVDLYAGTMGRKGEKKAVMIEERLLTDEEG